MLTHTQKLQAVETSERLLESGFDEAPTTLEAACEAFHNHADNCPDCHEHVTALCPIGDRLLAEAAAVRQREREEGILPVVRVESPLAGRKSL